MPERDDNNDVPVCNETAPMDNMGDLETAHDTVGAPAMCTLSGRTILNSSLKRETDAHMSNEMHTTCAIEVLVNAQVDSEKIQKRGRNKCRM
jgi:hypothetical protein